MGGLNDAQRAVEMRELTQGFKALARDYKALSERVDYLTVAACRGDPRFARAEYAKPDFDGAAFDADWAKRSKRVPSAEEVFGQG